ncbi:RICIN domain-containing protein [Actinosynnema sp. CS-041913]|uniref:RICIN domain-containing protein n=1 Tax=Actinosynnema sp. CS-041913 TaxID=3239917 RepID=UPI003D8E0D73
MFGRVLRIHTMVLAAVAACVVQVGVSSAVAAPTPEGITVTGLPPADPGAGARHDRSESGVNALYGPFNIRAQNSNKCLDIAGGPGARSDGDPAIIWDCYGINQTNQQWYFRDTGDQYVYYLVAVHSNKCLDIAGGPGAVSDGDPAHQWACLGYYQTNQKWYLSSYTVDGRTIYKLTAIHSGKCLDVAGGVGAINNGTRVHQWGCLGDQQTNQRWYLTSP